MKKSTIIIIAIIALVVILGIALVSANNNLVSMEAEVDAAFANIDTNLQRRADLIPNLLLAAAMGVVVHCVSYLPLNTFWMLLAQVLVGVAAYVGLSIFTKNDNFKYLLSTLKDFKNKK